MQHIAHPPVIGITMGDPVGIGPEIVLKAFSDGSLHEICRPLVLGDIGVMTGTRDRLGAAREIHQADLPEQGIYRPGTIDVIGLSSLDYPRLRYGSPTAETGRAMVGYITQGIDWAMDGRIQGLVTCPINKLAMHMAGIEFDGHTELLADRTGSRDTVMMLAGDRLRVALVTIHIPLALVPDRLTTEAVFNTIRITAEALLNSFGIARPRLAVAALNPHAGEGGLFGDEEKRIIVPAIERAARAGIDASGPYPPDTVFHAALGGAWDAVVSMYHDQGLIPFKMVHFTDGVNITLGIPFVRTSVDHGTAYDIAGKGTADQGSLLAAVRMAVQMAKKRVNDRIGKQAAQTLTPAAPQ